MPTVRELFNQARFNNEIAVAILLTDRGASSVKDIAEALDAPEYLAEAILRDMCDATILREVNGFYTLVSQRPMRVAP